MASLEWPDVAAPIRKSLRTVVKVRTEGSRRQLLWQDAVTATGSRTGTTSLEWSPSEWQALQSVGGPEAIRQTPGRWLTRLRAAFFEALEAAA